MSWETNFSLCSLSKHLKIFLSAAASDYAWYRSSRLKQMIVSANEVPLPETSIWKLTVAHHICTRYKKCIVHKQVYLFDNRIGFVYSYVASTTTTSFVRPCNKNKKAFTTNKTSSMNRSHNHHDNLCLVTWAESGSISQQQTIAVHQWVPQLYMLLLNACRDHTA